MPAADNGVNAWSDASIYTAPSGAMVFSAGTLQWSFGLDNGFNTGFCDCDHNVVNAAAQRATQNILDRFTAPSTTAPAVAVAPSSLTFGAQRVGTTSSAQTTTLTNTGGGPLTITGVTATGDFTRTGDTCPRGPSTLAAGATCTVTIVFSPTAPGSRSGAVQFADDATGSPQSVALSGSATQPAATLDQATLAFGTQLVGTTSATRTATLTNTGSAPLSIASVTPAGDYTLTSTCPLAPATLAVGAGCSLNVTFAPGATGARAGTLKLVDDAPGAPHTVVLSGTGIQPAVSLSAPSLTFGAQVVTSTSPAQTVTLRNAGDGPLSLSSLAAGGDFSATSDCGSGLAAGAACTISVRFAPSAGGSRSGTLTIADSAPGAPHTVALSGTGTVDTVAPSIQASAPAYATSSALAVGYTASDADSGLARVDLFVRAPGATGFVLAGSGTSGSFSYLATSAGPYVFHTVATDRAGNSATSDDVTTFFDPTAPSSSATAPAYSASTTITVGSAAADADSGVATVELYAKGPGDSAFTKVPSFTYTASGPGAVAFATRAIDKAGNAEPVPTAAQATTIVDLTAPVSSASAPSATSTATFNVTYTAADSALDTVELWARGPSDATYTRVATAGAASGAFPSPPPRTAPTASTRSRSTRPATSRPHPPRLTRRRR